jgi:adenylosuccinate lyase
MIDRYTTTPMNLVWDSQTRFKHMFTVEILACQAMEILGGVPVGVAKRCQDAMGENHVYDEERISSIEFEVKHDVIAFLTYLKEVIGEDANYLHKGMTSSDVVDTVFSVQLVNAGTLILSATQTLLDRLAELSLSHKNTICMGRSHGMHAEPTTFGFKMAVHHSNIRRCRNRFSGAVAEISVGKVSGAVGTFSHFPQFVESYVCENLGILPSPISTQIIQRDFHAFYFQTLALLATVIEQLAVEIRHLHRSEVGEVQESFTKGQKGSSAMPHKKNPMASENITGLARLVRGYAESAMDNVVLWHERDISHSSVERVIAPDTTQVMHFMITRMARVIETLVVNEDVMLKNLEITNGGYQAQRFLLELVNRGIDRDSAYGMVQLAAMKSLSGESTFRDAILGDKSIVFILGEEFCNELSDPHWYTRNVESLIRDALTL